MRFIALIALALGCSAAPQQRDPGVELTSFSSTTDTAPLPAPAPGTCRWTPPVSGGSNTHYVSYHQLPVSGNAEKMCQRVHSEVYLACFARVACGAGAGHITVSITSMGLATSKDCGQGAIAAITGTSVPTCVA